MSLDDRTEWFMAAAGFLDNVPASLLTEAARYAACDHPSKIVPAILAYVERERENWEWRNRPASKAARLTVFQERKPVVPLSQSEIDELPNQLVDLGIACGYLRRDDNGNLRYRDD